MFFIIDHISKLLGNSNSNNNNNNNYDLQYDGSSQSYYPPAPHRKSCRQLKHERRLERQTRRTERMVARAERRNAVTVARATGGGGCCGGRKRRRGLEAAAAAAVQFRNGGHVMGGAEQHYKVGQGYNENGVTRSTRDYEYHHVQDEEEHAAEWQAGPVPDEAPPSYKEVVKG